MEIYDDKVYYSPYKNEDMMCDVVCWQDFDLCDYSYDRFFKTENGEIIKFESEDECIFWINQKIKLCYIAKIYRKINDDDYYK